MSEEWRDGDLVYDKFDPDLILKFGYDKSSQKYLITKGSALMAYYDHLPSLQANYVNITAQQRELEELRKKVQG